MRNLSPLPLTLAAAALCSLTAPAQVISTIAGNPVPLVNGQALGQFIESPLGRVGVDANGNVYVAATVACQILKINPTTGAMTVVAGTGQPGFLGDGGPATNAQLNFPYNVTADAAGNLYVPDFRNNRIRRIDAAGVITTFAGNGTLGFSGDGGPAAGAQLRAADGVAVDSAGNVYISDTSNHRIRKVTTAGVISTFAGTGTSGFSGDGGAATAAQLSLPRTVAIDSTGSICFADSGNHRIRCVNSGGTINTVAGTGTSGFNGYSGTATAIHLNSPFAVAADSLGNLYAAERNNHLVRRIAPAGTISTIAGTGSSGFAGDGGPAANAQLNSPSGVAVDATGNVYITDDNFRVRRVATSGVISSVAGKERFSGDSGQALNALLSNPTGMARDANGNLYIGDQGNHRIRRIDSAGNITTFAGTGVAGSAGDGGQAAAASLNAPAGLAVDAAANLFVAEAGGHRIRRISSAGVISTLAGTGAPTSTGDGGAATSATLNTPQYLALDPAGNLYVSEQNGHRIRRINPSGTITAFAGTGTLGFAGDGGSALAAQFAAPIGIALDTQGNLYIADRGNHRIRRVSSAGNISTVAGTGLGGFIGDGGPATSAQLFNPNGVSVDAAGNLWISDLTNGRIRFVSGVSGVIATVAGNGSTDFIGDGGPPVNAGMRGPNSVHLPGDGRVIIADTGNGRLRQFTIASPVAATFLSVPAGRTITVDNSLATAPFTRVWAQGSSHSVTVGTPQSVGASERFVFNNWTDTGATAARTIEATAEATYTANFTRQFFLTGQANPVGSGTVTNGWFNTGTQVTVQAAPGGGYQFAGFSGSLTGAANPQTLVMNGPANVTASFTPVQSNSAGRRYIPVTPCRLVDTREAGLGAFGAPFLAANSTRSFAIPQRAGCGIPAGAAAYSLNVTVVPREPLGYLTIFPTGTPQPLVSTLNSLDGRIKANAAVVPAGTNGAVSIFVPNATELILDINGYFIDPAVSAQGLSFYPITPCRVMDTRNPNGSLGGPVIPAGGSREIPVRSSNCGVPTSAQAYSVNATVVPSGPLGFLTLWPTGAAQPFVSTLNAPTGAITANAAIVPAGTSGAISAFMSSASHLVLDINGYFAPPGAANAQSFYSVAPCRLLDTRNAAGEFGGPALAASDARSFRLPLANCGLPAAAAAFSLNATVVPAASLGFLTLWPTGAAQPFVSTLNALDASITSNAAIVPAGAAGAVSSIATDQTHLILDTNGYFAP